MANISDNFLPLSHGSKADQLAIRNALKNREGSVVPVIFGQVKIDGNQLWLGDINKYVSTTPSNAAKLLQYGDMTQAYVASIWFLIGMGKLHLKQVLANDKGLIAVSDGGVDYSTSNFNDGTQSYIPSISSIVRFRLLANYIMYGYTTDAIIIIMSGSITTASDYYRIGSATNGSIFVESEVLGLENGITNFAYSSNGISYNWGEGKSFYSAHACIWGDSLFISIGSGGGSNRGEIYTSIDGKAWTIKALTSLGITPAIFRAVCEGQTVIGISKEIIAVGDGELIVGFSSSGYLDKLRYGQTGNLYGIAYGNGRYVTVGVTAAGTALMLMSTDGVTWVDCSYGLACSLKAICFNGTYFLAVGTNDKWAKSTDGITWSDGTTGLLGTWNSIAYGDSKFVIGGNSGKIATAATEASWSDISGTYFGPTWNGSAFITSDVKEVFFNEFASFGFATKLKGISHIFFPWSTTPATDYSVVCNSEGKSPSMKFVVQNLMDNLTGVENELGAGNLIIGDATNLIGCNPAAAIYTILRHAQWGLNIPFASIDQTSFNAAADIFDTTRPYGINLIASDLTTGRELIDRICELTDLFLVEENDIIYLRSMYSATATSVLSIGDNDAQDVSISRQTWKDIDNVFEGDYVDPQLNYEKKTLIIKNESAILNAGYEKKKKIDLTMFITSAVASQRLNEIMQRESFPKVSASFKMGRAAYALRPGDLVTWVNTEYGINSIFRVQEINIGKLDDMSIGITLIQAFENLFDGNYKTVAPAAGNVPERTV